MSQSKLDPDIVRFLSRKTGLAEATVKKDVYLLRRNYPTSTLNAVAQLYAVSKGLTIFRKLSKEDKATLPNIEVEKEKTRIKEKRPQKKEKDEIIITYVSDDYFIKGHIKEINKAYTKGCYTSVHILIRKVIENLIREILVKYFPPTSKANKELYFDIDRRRFKDFGVVLKNLHNKRHSFEPDKIIERLCQKTKKFKDDANDATHSWYYLIERKREIDDLNSQSIIELINKLLN